MKTSPLGGGYTIHPDEQTMYPERILNCAVVMSLSAGITFPVLESLTSFFHHNWNLMDLVIFYESEGENALSRKAVLELVEEAEDASAPQCTPGSCVRHNLFLVDCRRVNDTPRPFVGPKVCTYTVADFVTARAYLFLDLDLWHFESAAPLVLPAIQGHVVLTAEANTGTLHDAMFLPDGVYNGEREDYNRYWFNHYACLGAYASMTKCLNSGVLAIGFHPLRKVQEELESPTFRNLSAWMFRPNGKKFIGNREQALVNLAIANRCQGKMMAAPPNWNVQLVAQPLLYTRPDDKPATLSDTEVVNILHFNGYAAPYGPARKAHEHLHTHQPKTVAKAGVPARS